MKIKINGARLKQARKARGWRQIDIAASLYVSEATIGNYERGLYPAPVERIKLLAEELGVSVDWLIEKI